MSERIPHGRNRLPLSAVATAILVLCANAQAQQAAEPAAAPATEQKKDELLLERVEITGSIIRRVSQESALPVTSISATELEKRGHTELKEYVLELPQASSLGTFGGTAGTVTNLRGFGPMRSLTLLNGRRLAKEPLSNQYVSVNVIPRMALQRTDVLRDGASSSYGSDAIGGVEAFYTKATHTGIGLKAEAIVPRRDGGGDSQTLGMILGAGDIATDRWNAYVALEVQKRDVLLRKDRPEMVDGTALGQLGISTAPGLGSNATPGNFTDPTNPTASLRTIRYNPYYASGCLPPYSVPSTASSRQTCFLDTDANYRAFTNGNDISTLYGKVTFNLGANHQASLEYNLGKYTVLQYNDPIPVTVRLTNAHPYYPGNGIVPAVAGLNLGGRPIDVLWSVADLGSRVREDHHTNERIVFADEGSIAGWDYRAGVNFGNSERDTRAGRGWATVTGLASVQGSGRTLFLDPLLNPFGLQTAEGLALLQGRSVEGQTFRLHRATNESVDLTVTRELAELSGGALALAAGGEYRRDGWRAIGLASNDPKASLNGQIDLLGGDSQAAGATSSTSNQIKRSIKSLFAELEAPVTKSLTLNAALRADKYGDLGETTVNPKLSVRWQPSKAFLLRGSANTGYRAPSLPEIYTKETERTSMSTFDDPTLCPTVNGVETPAPGYTPEQVCNLTGRFQITKVPSNSGVKSETSRSFTFGMAFEPVNSVAVTLDYWHTQINDVIGNRSIDFILNNPSLYPTAFRRNPDGTLQTDAVFNVPSNVGAMRGSGIDASIRVTAPKSDYGVFSGALDVAYLTRWDARSPEANGGDWISALGQFNDVVPVNPNAGLSNATRGMNFRWRHTASIGWKRGDWETTLSQRYQSKIRDQNLPARTGAGTSGPRDVSSYEQYNIALSYSGVKNLKLGFGVNNLFDAKPPLTNHNGYQGYLTSSVDVLGRAYRLSAEYKF
ncbi:MAG: TonB-dependent receptor [Piscinibacter sp.]|nr:TonB-dependent receptor [Piscinibacter sp.]